MAEVLLTAKKNIGRGFIASRGIYRQKFLLRAKEKKAGVALTAEENKRQVSQSRRQRPCNNCISMHPQPLYKQCTGDKVKTF